MTHTINGIGTHIVGERELTEDEFINWSSNLPIKPYAQHPQFYIGTKAFVIIFIPIIPLNTFVYYKPDSTHYVTCFYPPDGDPCIYWSHVKSSIGFYILPILLIIWLIYTNIF